MHIVTWQQIPFLNHSATADDSLQGFERTIRAQHFIETRAVRVSRKYLSHQRYRPALAASVPVPCRSTAITQAGQHTLLQARAFPAGGGGGSTPRLCPVSPGRAGPARESLEVIAHFLHWLWISALTRSQQHTQLICLNEQILRHVLLSQSSLFHD